jgi:hypothetical protein
MREIVFCLSILVVIILLFLFVNMYLKKQIDNFGIYCGRYNLNPSNAKVLCSADSNCQWNTTTDPSNGISNSWCTDAPASSENDTPIYSEYIVLPEESTRPIASRRSVSS